MSASGKMVEGTGRFAGISGTIEFKGRGIDAMADGNLGDIFATGRATALPLHRLRWVAATNVRGPPRGND